MSIRTIKEEIVELRRDIKNLTCRIQDVAGMEPTYRNDPLLTSLIYERNEAEERLETLKTELEKQESMDHPDRLFRDQAKKDFIEWFKSGAPISKW
jgi:DNA repair exonuclease SbcCD ATPase subunit